MTIVHCLKTWPEFYKDIVSGDKTFEVRKDDRPFRFSVGNILRLQEFMPDPDGPTGEYTGEEITVTVTYKLEGGNFGIEEGFCVLGIEMIEE